MILADLRTPVLAVDLSAFEHNVSTMGARWPGTSLRPHVKAFKSTDLARRLADAGHVSFCAATVREIEGLARAGLDHDLLLANEVLDTSPLGRLVEAGSRVTVAVDSTETIVAAAAGGVQEVLVDVDVGLPRCGCAAHDAPRLADLARSKGLAVRGVMGYEGHIVGVGDRSERDAGTRRSMEILAAAHAEVGGEVVSGGGTGTWDLNNTVTELQAGSYTLMDTAYGALDLPFRRAVAVIGRVISAHVTEGYAVADVGLKALGMDHGNPTIEGATVWFCSDEHVTFSPAPAPDGTSGTLPSVGDHIVVWPAHIDPTIALHERMCCAPELPGAAGTGVHTVSGDLTFEDLWAVDLRNW